MRPIMMHLVTAQVLVDVVVCDVMLVNHGDVAFIVDSIGHASLNVWHPVMGIVRVMLIEVVIMFHVLKHWFNVYVSVHTVVKSKS